MNAARAGFYWWELDLTYYVLRVLALLGIVWDLHPVPAKVLEEGVAGGVSGTVTQTATDEVK
jgi:stearoyl-CoA desaturase (delta-9 desaturase)